jgi:hypothetical protein
MLYEFYVTTQQENVDIVRTSLTMESIIKKQGSGKCVDYGVKDDNNGKSDNWTDYTAKYLEPVKHISTFDEWHMF